MRVLTQPESMFHQVPPSRKISLKRCDLTGYLLVFSGLNNKAARTVLRGRKLTGGVIIKSKMKTVFRSRISILLTIVFWTVFLFGYFLVFKSYRASHNAEFIVILVIFSLIIILFCFIWFGVRYIITENKLIIKVGSIRFAGIRISEIVSIHRTYNPLSSAAVSLKRISLKLKPKSKFPYILISPNNEKQFIDLLLDQNPNIEVNVPCKKSVWRIFDWDI